MAKKISAKLRIDRWKQELTTTGDYLQSIIEELQATNEELLSKKATLQIINEKLDAAKEELKASTDELNRLTEDLQDQNLDLTRLLSAIHIPIVVVDAGLCIRRFTPAATKMVNLISTDVGRPIGNISLNIDASDLEPWILDGIDTYSAKEREVQDKHGHWYSMRMRPYKESDDKVGAVILWTDIDATVNEITERRKAEEALKEAEGSNRIKDEFLATLSHELRTPLSAVLGWARLLRSGKLDEETYARALEAVERNADAQLLLIEDLLDVSRIITGKLQLDAGPVDLGHVIEAALAAVGVAAEAKAIRLQKMLDPETGLVLGDPGRLQQVVWNLLSNAVKFTPKGGQVEVRLERVGSYACIKVSDTGIGIKAAFLPYLFERFRQADSSTTRIYSGLGLGLAIMRHLVELHGGTVHAESPGEGQGATFIVKLPIMAVPKDDIAYEVALTRAAGKQGLSSPVQLNDLRVLVVDDEVDTRELLTILLTQYGAQVVAVGSVQEALKAFAECKPDVLVSNVGMPGDDGLALIRAVRALDPEQGGGVPAVALTPYAGGADRVRALSAGYQTHVLKPVEPAELLAVVSMLVGRNKKRSQPSQPEIE